MDIEQLYFIMNSEDIIQNPFNTQEEHDAFETLYSSIAHLEKNNEEKFYKTEDLLLEFLAIERRTAFKVGFKTAVTLFSSALGA